MADVKISELDAANLAAVKSAGLVPVSVPNDKTYKLPLNDILDGSQVEANVVYNETQHPNFGEMFDAAQDMTADGHTLELGLDSVQLPHIVAGAGLGIETLSSPVGKRLFVKVGPGLSIDPNNNVVALDTDAAEVVEEVQKLSEDLDKKVTTTYNFAQITTMSDFASFGVSGTNRMMGQLFSVPITTEIRKDETLLCVNALQSYNGNVSIALFEFDFEANNGTGSTYWIADTGTVRIQAGENEFPVRHILQDVNRPKIELMSSRLYYACICVASDAPASGLMLASCPGYGATYNAVPLYTMKVSNLTVDWTSGDLSGTWFQGHNEDNTIPRLFMMLRNSETSEVVTTGPFVDIGSFTLSHTNRISALFSVVPESNGGVYQKVIPAEDVDIKKFSYVDYHGSLNSSAGIPLILDSTLTALKTSSDATCIVGDGDQTKIDGTHYLHTYELTTALHLTAGNIYWFPAGLNLSNLGDEWLIQYSSPSVTRDLQLVKNLYNVNEWINQGGAGEFKSAQTAPYLKLEDIDGNSWVI